MSVEDLSESLGNLRIGSSSDSSSTDSQNPPNSFQISRENQNIFNLSRNRITQSNQNTNLINMSQFKTEYLNCVPQFNGDPNELNRYLSICESLIANFYKHENPNDFQNTYLLNSLISKLTGNAKVIVNIQNVSTWDELKTTLLRNFADQRDESCLNRDLVLMRQLPNENPQQFYDRVLEILNLICSYINAHEITDVSKNLKRDLYNNLALRTFLSGLKEPLSTTIRCMKPQTLSEALQLVIQEDNVHYFQNYSNKNFVKNTQVQNKPQVPNNQRFVETPRQFQFNAYPSNSYRPNNFGPQNFNRNYFPSQPVPIQPRINNQPFPSQPIAIQPRMNYQPQKFFTNSQVFKQPQQNNNVFKPNPNRTLPQPTPMSVTSRNTTNQYQQGPSTSRQYYQPQKNFSSEKLFNTELNQPGQNLENSQLIDYNYQNDEFNEYHNFNEFENAEISEIPDENFQTLPQLDDQT